MMSPSGTSLTPTPTTSGSTRTQWPSRPASSTTSGPSPSSRPSRGWPWPAWPATPTSQQKFWCGRIYFCVIKICDRQIETKILISKSVIGGCIAQRQRSWFSPSSPGFNSQHSWKIFRGKIIDVAVVKQHCWLEESGQWFKNVDQIHLVLASGMLVLQKICTW